MAQQQEVAPATSPSKKAKSAAKKSGGKKKNQPGRYSQLVVDTIRSLGERSGSSLAKIYGEAKKVPWFDQQNGRTYLKYSVRALVQNDTLLQVKGQGANGSFRLNKKKLEGLAVPPRKKPAGPPKPAAKKKAAAPQKKGTPKKAKPAPKKKSSKSPKKASGSRAPPGKAKKASKPKGLKAKKA